MNDDLQIIAEESRRAMERFAKKHQHIGSTYDLGGFCGISSYLLSIVAKKFGYHVTLVEGVAFSECSDPNHCWAQYKELIIDITATQFGCSDKVHVTKVSDKKYKKIRRLTKTRKNFKFDWGDQSPYEYLPKLQAMAEEIACKIEA